MQLRSCFLEPLKWLKSSKFLKNLDLCVSNNGSKIDDILKVIRIKKFSRNFNEWNREISGPFFTTFLEILNRIRDFLKLLYHPLRAFLSQICREFLYLATVYCLIFVLYQTVFLFYVSLELEMLSVGAEITHQSARWVIFLSIFRTLFPWRWN